MKRHCFTLVPFFALIGLLLSPLAAHTSSSSTGQSSEPISTFYAPDGNITSVAFSPDGRLLALESLYDPPEFRLWDVSAGQSIAAFSTRGIDWWTGTFSSDGRLLAGKTEDGTIELWDVSRGVQHVATISAHEYGSEASLSEVSFSPDGRLLASSVHQFSSPTSPFRLEIKLWDVSRGVQHVATINDNSHKNSVVSLVFSSDGRLLASLDYDGLVGLWDVSRGARVATISAHEGPSDLGLGEPLSFSSDGSLLASAGSSWSGVRYDPDDGDEGEETTEVKLWDVSTGQSIATLAGSSPVSFSPKGRLLASVSANKIKWVYEITGDNGYLSHRTDFGGQNIELWDVSTGQSIATLSLSDDLKRLGQLPQTLVFSPDGRLLASQHGSAVQLWDVSEWIPQARLTPDPSEVEFSADDPVWKTFTVHTNLDSVLVRANPSGSDPALEVAGGQQVPTSDYCPAEGNDRPTRGAEMAGACM